MVWYKHEFFDVAVTQHKTIVALVRWHSTPKFWANYLDDLTDVLNVLNLANAGSVLMDIRQCDVCGTNTGGVCIKFAYRRFWLKDLKMVDLISNVKLQNLFNENNTPTELSVTQELDKTQIY